MNVTSIILSKTSTKVWTPLDHIVYEIVPDKRLFRGMHDALSFETRKSIRTAIVGRLNHKLQTYRL